MIMIKHRFISMICVTSLTCIGMSATAKCAADTDMKTYIDMVEVLNSNRSGLRTARDIARKNGKAKGLTKERSHVYQRIDLISNRLEYWSKDTARYVRKYAKTHPDAVCDRMDNDHVYMDDFLTLGLIYKLSPTAAYPQLHDGLYK